MSSNRAKLSCRAQQGYALLLAMVVMVMASVTILVQAVANPRADRETITRRALLDARQAIIGFSTTASQGPGHLPCPDFNNDGISDGAACTQNAVGRFPWKTLDAGDLRDGNGEQLWYAISDNFINNDTPPHPVNSNTRGELDVTGMPASEAIAIVFAPGGALVGQNRETSVQERNAANYLEGANADGIADAFEARPTSTVFNDQLLLIQAADIFPAVEAIVIRKMERDVFKVLDEYKKAWKGIVGGGGFLPYPAPFAANSSYCGQVDESATELKGGLLPASKAGTCVSSQGTNAKVLNAMTFAPNGNPGMPLCERVPANDDKLMTLRCKFSYNSAGFSDPPQFTLNTDITGVTQSFALPITKSSITPEPYNGGSTLAQALDAGILKIAYSHDLAPTTSKTEVTIDIPVYFAPDHLKKPGEDATWFFNNEWYRVVYYAASPDVMEFSRANACTRCLTVINSPEPRDNKDVVLVLAGMRLLDRPRPSDVLSNYFEGRNTLDAAQYEFESYRYSRSRNDKVAGMPISP